MVVVITSLSSCVVLSRVRVDTYNKCTISLKCHGRHNQNTILLPQSIECSQRGLSCESIFNRTGLDDYK